ncbi:unnamed protein product, partial [Protopolystoma xenopodis]
EHVAQPTDCSEHKSPDEWVNGRQLALNDRVKHSGSSHTVHCRHDNKHLRVPFHLHTNATNSTAQMSTLSTVVGPQSTQAPAHNRIDVETSRLTASNNLTSVAYLTSEGCVVSMGLSLACRMPRQWHQREIYPTGLQGMLLIVCIKSCAAANERWPRGGRVLSGLEPRPRGEGVSTPPPV